MTRIFCDNPGSCIEPGGMELDNDKYEVPCDVCGNNKIIRNWQDLEGGSINNHSSEYCHTCFMNNEIDCLEDDCA